jgi:DGQHR domain-containing protein
MFASLPLIGYLFRTRPRDHAAACREMFWAYFFGYMPIWVAFLLQFLVNGPNRFGDYFSRDIDNGSVFLVSAAMFSSYIYDTAPSRNISDIARVIDGQHRIAGLEAFRGQNFDVPVTIFVGADLADQAYVFSTVNLEQTKVRKSLSYDLFSLARSRSPQKTAHNIAIALDADTGSAFFNKIKRLGFARPDAPQETLTQATFVEMLMGLISRNPKVDRDSLLRGRKLDRLSKDGQGNLVFRNLFIDEQDVKIAEIVNNYFLAIQSYWPNAWRLPGRGNILGRTNGFRALMRVLPAAYRTTKWGNDLSSPPAWRRRA